MSRKKNLRRLSVLVTAQTLHNLERLAAMDGSRNLGRVVDKLTREKMLALHGDHLRDTTKMKRRTEKGAQKWIMKRFCEQR